MRCVKLGTFKSLLLAQILLQLTGSSSLSGFEGELEDGLQEEESSKQQQQGSWARWWSYDGISGPDYWNINKRWRLCSSGRKQSPVDLSTELLVHDHLLGAIQLDWLPLGLSIEEAEREIARRRRPSAPNQAGRSEDDEKEQFQRPTVRAQLLNSGRGFEVWLEGGPSKRSADPGKDAASQQQQLTAELDQLILSGGPLSYAYKLFKMELHSSPSNRAGRGAATGSRLAHLAESQPPQQQPEALDLDRIAARSSEHQIDGRSFDGELQLHFYNRHLAGSANQALLMADEGTTSSSNLFAVVSVFIIQTDAAADRDEEPPIGGRAKNNNTSNRKGGALDFMLSSLQIIPNEADSVELRLARSQIDGLIPDREQYVTYQGSLNRPPCSESVDWVLTNKPLRIEMDKFQSLFAASFKTTQDNVRPIKPLHGRLLRTTINNLSAEARVGYSAPAPTSDCRGSLASSTNCSRSSGAKQDKAAGSRWQEAPSKCSMKPKYAYQLSESFKEL